MQNKTIQDTRFHEIDTMWEWISLWLKIKKILYKNTSKYQDILVFESYSYGKVLVLDGVIQITEKDEYAYQEMLAHTWLNLFHSPKNILIIWGGDGWILREVLKYDSIKNVTLCEIDEEVINVSKKYFPSISYGYHDFRTNLVIWDGADFVKNTTDIFDIIIVDSSDPIWPAETLFIEDFYISLKKILSPNWIITIQWESLFLHNNLAKKLAKNMRKIFSFAKYAQVHVPTYPAGNIWLLVCSDEIDPIKPLKKCPSYIQKNLKYYSPEMHKSSFILPYYCKNI